MINQKRILTLDLLRGFFLLVIFTDHLFRFPNIFELFTGQGQLWVSAAEGFFIISGLLVGCVYGPKISHNSGDVWSRLWRRAGQLYLCSVGLTLLFTLWGQFFPMDEINSGLWAGTDLFNLLFKTATFQYVYGWADFLVFYTVFMLFAPLVLWMTKRFNGWSVIIPSVIIWCFFRTANSCFAWQLLFMSGLVIGSGLPTLELKFENLSHGNRGLIRNTLGLITGLTILLSVYFVFGIGQWHPSQNVVRLLEPLFDKNAVGPGRFLLAWLWFAALFLFVRPREKTIDRLTLGVLGVVGQNSLFAYCLQAVVLFPVNAFIPAQMGFFRNSLITMIGIFLIYFVVIVYKRLVHSARSVVNGLERIGVY